MPRLKPCWSCGAVDAPCFSGCECVKCVDPVGYAEWRSHNPGEYQRWLASNLEDEDEAQSRWERSMEMEDYW